MRDLKKSANSLETRKIRKILNEEARLGISPNSESDTEEVDLQKELYPLGHYINNREEMIEQMFSIIKGTKLNKMLPPILKDMPLDELKADCLIHLLGMSKKRIRAILEGREINSSSDSESHSDSSVTPNKKPKVELKPFVIKQEGCSDISDNSEEVVLVDPDLDFLNLADSDCTMAEASKEKKPKRKLKKKDVGKKHKRSKTKVVEEASDSDEVQQIDSSAESVSGDEIETEAPKEGKTLLEILELEMRARAIRALLKNNDPQESEERQSVETQNPGKSKKKSDKHLKEDMSIKITPAKNFRKKKRKSDDVIVIAPKVVTIDLTDENEQSAKNNREKAREENSLNNRLNGEQQETLSNDKPQTNSDGNRSSVTDEITVISEGISETKRQNTSERVTSCLNEKSSKVDSNMNKSAQQEQGKSNWAQRWLDSKEVKKVVSTSKICGNIRKKIKSAKLARMQTPVQDEPVKPSSAPQKEIEGSVGEYELLSKSKTMSTNEVDGINNITQASILSTNQELTPDSADTSSADQVQDVSSTRAENLSTSPLEDNVSGLQTNEEEINNANKSGEFVISGTDVVKLTDSHEILNSAGNNESLPPFTTDEVKKTSDLECLSKRNEDLENSNTLSVNQTEQLLLVCGEENLIKNEETEEHLKSCEIANSEAPKKETSNTLSECCETLPIDMVNTKGSECDSQCLQTEHSESDTPKTSQCNDKNGSYQKQSKQMKNKPKNSERILEETHVSKDCEDIKKVASPCSAKPAQELNEPETLEINITDEDRDIEDSLEDISDQNQSKSLKDNIIVVD